MAHKSNTADSGAEAAQSPIVDVKLLKAASKQVTLGGYSDDDDVDVVESGANALIMPAGKKSKKRKAIATIPEIPLSRMERRLSKSKARKLANVEVRVKHPSLR